MFEAFIRDAVRTPLDRHDRWLSAVRADDPARAIRAGERDFAIAINLERA